MPRRTLRQQAPRYRVPMDAIRDICLPLAEGMWAVHHGTEGGPRLIFPVTRADIPRVSEQESKILLCQVLERSPWFYSVETPTREKYMQSGTRGLSARTDATVYSSRSASDHLLNVELKAGVPPVENFRKDFEKLVRETTDGLWFHTLAGRNSATLRTLTTRMTDAVRLVSSHADVAAHSLTLAICVLEDRLLLTATLPLGADLGARLDLLGDPSGAAWTATGPGAGAFRAGGPVQRAVPRASA